MFIFQRMQFSDILYYLIEKLAIHQVPTLMGGGGGGGGGGGDRWSFKIHSAAYRGMELRIKTTLWIKKRSFQL